MASRFLTAIYVAGYTYLALRRAYGISRGLAVRDTAIEGVRPQELSSTSTAACLRSLRRLFFSPGIPHARARRGAARPLAHAPPAVPPRPASRPSPCSPSPATSGVVQLTATGDPTTPAGPLVRLPQPGRAAAAIRRRARRLDAAGDVRARAVLRLAGRARPAPRRPALPLALRLRAARPRRRVRRAGAATDGRRSCRSPRSRSPTGSTSSTAIYVIGYLFLALRTAYGGTRGLAVRDTALVTVGLPGWR